jgi:hypothetical protein
MLRCADAVQKLLNASRNTAIISRSFVTFVFLSSIITDLGFAMLFARLCGVLLFIGTATTSEAIIGVAVVTTTKAGTITSYTIYCPLTTVSAKSSSKVITTQVCTEGRC